MGKCGIGVGFEGRKDSKQVFDGNKMAGGFLVGEFWGKFNLKKIQEFIIKKSPLIKAIQKRYENPHFKKQSQQNNLLRSKY